MDPEQSTVNKKNNVLCNFGETCVFILTMPNFISLFSSRGKEYANLSVSEIISSSIVIIREITSDPEPGTKLSSVNFKPVFLSIKVDITNTTNTLLGLNSYFTFIK